MPQKIFFNSSLPRSGSTLLQNIFAQRPDFYATPTSGTVELIAAARHSYSTDVTFKAQDKTTSEEAWRGFCKGGMFGYFNGITNKPYAVEKSRGWGFMYGMIEWFLEEKPKMVVMVRDMRDIITSLEKKYRNNMHIDPGFVDHVNFINTTVEKRVEHYLNTIPLSISIERLYEMLRQPNIANNVLFVRFEDLTSRPQEIMNSVYHYLEVPPFVHDFDNIRQMTHENDSMHGIFGDHQIRHKVKPLISEAREVLGDVIYQNITDRFADYNKIFNYQ